MAREFRAAWVATVDNIDWPSKKDLPVAEQQAELIAMMNRAVELKLNAILFQVRPACDALYQSTYEPWSEYLTGTMGKMPQPFYDPLAFAIEEAHKRGLELHAWFNPYRAHHPSGKSEIAANHISKTQPRLVRQYGKHLWLDPGEPEVQEHSLRVVMDVTRRYDVDGIHFDDYFYPYKERDAEGKELDFPDDASWKRVGAGTRLSRDDWRRENVNQFVRKVYQSLKAEKPWVKFGLSPFGIWRPGYPAQIKGFDAYAELYADSRLWLAKGWLDYFAPQLYWRIQPPEQSFPVLLKWWAQQNVKGRQLVPGLDATKTSRRWPPEEIVNQISLTRQQPGTSGHVHWNMKSLMRNATLDTALERGPYTQLALVPATPWLSQATPGAPRLSASQTRNGVEIRWAPADSAKVGWWLLQTRSGQTWSTRILPGTRNSCLLGGAPPETVALTAVDRYGAASRATALRKKP